jgi:hypothetical protein
MSTVPEITRAHKALYGPAPGSPFYSTIVAFQFFENGAAYPANTISPPTLADGTQSVQATCSRSNTQSGEVIDASTSISGSVVQFPTAAAVPQHGDPQETARTYALASLADAVFAALVAGGVVWPPQ